MPTHKLFFRVGQLAAAMIGLDESDRRYNFIGRVTSTDGENVTLAAFNGEQAAVTVANLKQAVHYSVDHSHRIVEGDRADALALDHPSWGRDWMSTSVVQRYNPDNGFFETHNTLYMPDYIMIEGTKLDSPLLK